MYVAAGGAPDPYEYKGDGSHIEFVNTTGRVRASAHLTPGERTAVFLVLGQSLAANYVMGAGNLYTPTSDKVQNLLFTNGAIYAAKDPMLGSDSTGGSWQGRLGDKLITDDMYDRVIFATMGVGNSSVQLWDTGALAEYPLLGFRRLAALGLTVTAVLWQQGETDKATGTSQAAYKASLRSIIDKARAAGFSSPWLLAKSTWQAGAGSPGIGAAIDALVSEGPDIFAGANTDSLNDTYRAADQTHLLATGATANANLWAGAIEAADLPGMLV